MNSLSTSLAIILAIVTGGILLSILGSGVGHPMLLWIGLRNVVRRPSQSLLLLCGLVLSTAVIMATFGLQDSFTFSQTSYQLSALGNIDESITGSFTQAQLSSSIAQIKQNSNVQAVAAIGYHPQEPNIVSLRTGQGVPNVDFYSIPPSFDQVYGPLTDSTGKTQHFADLGINDAFVNEALAQNLAIQPNDTLQILFRDPNSTHIITITAKVRAILSHDVVVTGDTLTLGQATPEIILPFARGQQIGPAPANTIGVKNVGVGGMDDTGPGGSRSYAVDQYLKQLFHTNNLYQSSTIITDGTIIYPLKPDIINSHQGMQFFTSVPSLASLSQQFALLPPLFTYLLVGAGMLLLALLIILLAAERRAELGMSRALGLQRAHLVQIFLFEGCGYGIVAALLGIPLGIGITAIELTLLSATPAQDTGSVLNSVPTSIFGPDKLQLWVNWQSLLCAWCIGVLVTLAIVLITALWISRITIAMAMRDLDDPPSAHVPLPWLLRSLWSPSLDAMGHPLPETRARHLSRHFEMAGRLVWGLWIRGPLCIALGGILLLLNSDPGNYAWFHLLSMALLIAGSGLLVLYGVLGGTQLLLNSSGSQNRLQHLTTILLIAGIGLLSLSGLLGWILLSLNQPEALNWLSYLAIALLVTGVGLLIRWTVSGSKTSVPRRELFQRLSTSLIGIGWLIDGLSSVGTFLASFQPSGFSGTFEAPTTDTFIQVFLSILLLISGMVIVVMTNADLLATFLSATLRRMRGLAPIHRISLIYPLTFRFRTGVTVTLLSTITFLVLLLVTTNLNTIQQAQMTADTGGFQLEADVFSLQFNHFNTLSSQLQVLQTHQLLSQDFTDVSVLHPLYLPAVMATSITLNLPGKPGYQFPSSSGAPFVADDSFLSSTTMPLSARAQGYTANRQVWNAVKDHTNYAILTYDPQVAALPRQNGFTPFTALLPESSGSNAPKHLVTIIGIAPASTYWQGIYLSTRTALSITQTPYSNFLSRYLFHLRPNVNETQAIRELATALDVSHTGIVVQSLDQGSTNGIIATLTLFFSSYLILGLLFGAFAIGVITSRAVIERRQQIGMLRALGFSRTLVRSSFLLESSFVVLLSVLVGAVLAFWLAYQVTRASYADFPLPILPVLLILLGSFLIALISTVLPAHRATRVLPAEALRYE